MPLKIVDCEEETIISFGNNIKKEDYVKHTCIEETKSRSSNSLILGKINKVLSFSEEADRYILLVKELLPSYDYGGKFKALVEGSLARELARFSPQTGDRVAFFEPFIFFNPAYEPEKSIDNKKQPKYLLLSKYDGEALMWFAKKQKMGGKSDDDKRVKQARNPEKSVQHNASSTSKQSEYVSLPGGSISGQFIVPSDEKSKKQNADVVQTSGNVRQKPLIQLPQKPQIPVDTKRLNPHYTYKTISSIKSSDIPRSFEQSVNFFGVVHDIKKKITTTNKNKYTLICMLIDDSDEDSGKIKFHIFVPEDTIIKQIDQGDILRLHRVKLESFNDKIDGRIFFSHDVVIFKKDYPGIKPITVAKNTLITDDEKKRVETLKKWYSEYLRRPTLLSDIDKSGKYCIFCKVVKHEPKKEENVVKIPVTDGSAIKRLVPAIPLNRYKGTEVKVDHIVTEIITHNKLDEYARLKVDDFVLFCDVEAVEVENEKLRLEINSDTSPEVSIEKTLHVADIECRIKQFLKSVNKNTEAKDKNDSNSSEQENETSVKTRQQKSKQKNSPSKSIEKSLPAICDNKYDRSCLKPNTGTLNNKDDCDAKNTESDPGTKSRKQLFTPNYMTDLSDAATDETSEHNVEMSKHSSNKVPDEDVVNPANTNFNDIVEKVKTKYCTPKKPGEGHPNHSQDGEGIVRRASSRKTQEGNKVPLVMLERLSSSGGYSDVRLNTNRKRGVNASESQEDMDDAETVINISYKAAVLDRTRQGNKRTRIESLSTEEGNPRNNDADINHDSPSRGAKVTSWLFHPKNKIAANYQEDIANDEFDVAVIKQILCCDNHSPDMSKYISALCFRVEAFLLEVIPDPSSNPLDLVSGYCHSGCQRIFLYSAIKWLYEENSTIPLCPECIQLEQEKELQLMLMMELIIMDPTGSHGAVLAVRNHAEQFLNCSVAEFVKDEVVRQSRVRLLTDYTMQSTYRACTTPLLDISVSPLNSTSPTFVLVNSTLKLPRI